jgi:NAD-reducing hydrogenase small subunit
MRLGIIEGGVCNAENVHVLREFRAALQGPGRDGRLRGQRRACRRSATTSHLRHPAGGLCHRHRAGAGQSIPNDPELPLPLDKVHPIHEVVKIDYFLPGCPPSADAIWKFLTDLIAGRTPGWGASATTD